MDRSRKNNNASIQTYYMKVVSGITLILIILSSAIYSQDVHWYNNFGSKGADAPRSICVDESGDIYVNGVFQYGLEVANKRLESSGSSDIFLLKLNNEGDNLWIKQYGGSVVEHLVLNEYGNSVVCNKKYVYHAGIFDQFATFGDTTLKSNGGYDVFLEKLSKDGSRKWLMNIGGVGHDHIEKMTIDDEGNIYMTGFFYGDVSIGTFDIKHKACPRYIMKLDPNGELLWVNFIDGSAFGKEIIVDEEGNVFWFCTFNNKIKANDDMLIASGSQDICVMKYNKNGGLEWCKGIHGIGYDEVGEACLGIDGMIYLTGTFQQELEFNNTKLLSRGMQDAFLMKMDTDGNAIWARSAGGRLNDNGVCVARSNLGNIIWGGMFSDEVIFLSDTLTTNYLFDIFFALYTPDGFERSITPFGGNSQDKLVDIEISPKGDLVFAAKFNEEISSDKGDIKSQGYEDILIVKLDLEEEYLSTNESDPNIDDNIHFDIIPNPVHDGYAYIYCSQHPFISDQIDVISSNGKIIITQQSASFPYKLNLSHLEEGMYYVKIYEQEKIFVKKIIVQ